MSDEEVVPNAADPKAVRESGRKEKRREQQAEDDLRALLQQPAGRRFLMRLIAQKCHTFQTSYHPSGQQFAANEGRRGVGVELMTEIMALDPEAWITMLREQATQA